MKPRQDKHIEKRLYTLRESAVYMGRTLWSMRELVWAGKIPRIQDGRKIYLDVRDLDRYIEMNKRTEIQINGQI